MICDEERADAICASRAEADPLAHINVSYWAAPELIHHTKGNSEVGQQQFTPKDDVPETVVYYQERREK